MNISIKERLLRHVSPEPNTGCWLWTGHVDGKMGYGGFTVRGKSKKAHRAAYEVFCGPIPENFHVLHKCDVPSCVNPAHLWVGTNADNMHDKMRKKRWTGGKLNKNIVLEIRKSRKTAFELSEKYNVSPLAVAMAREGLTWKDV